ncbi:MAG TPA: hypothetical protein ENI15_01760 [Spirochaetes bacterium]|nr:hypothetical protein [Spirochaetota bacterium]
MKGQSVMRYINRFKCKEGTYKLLEWQATPVIEGIVYATARDITEKKQLEEQLQIRQRMDSLGTLAGGIAHDFNNLLTGILGYIDLLNLHSENLTETQKEYISNAVKSSQRAADLVMQLQTLSRGIVTKKKSVDLYETVEEVFKMLDKTTFLRIMGAGCRMK